MPVRRNTEVLGMVSHRKRSIRRTGLEKAQENHGTGAEGVTEREALTSLFVPLEIGLLDEERLSAVPT